MSVGPIRITKSDHDYVDEWGVGWTVVQYETRFGRGHYTEMTGHPLAQRRSRGKLPCRPTRTAQELYRDAAWTLHEFKDEYWIVGVTVTTIFETAWALRGYERLLTDLVTDPDLAGAILDIPYRYHLAAAQRLVEMGVDMIWVGDDVGTQTGMLISPDLVAPVVQAEMGRVLRRIEAIEPRTQDRLPLRRRDRSRSSRTSSRSASTCSTRSSRRAWTRHD